MNLAGDVRTRGRNLPLAIAGGMLVVVALYLVLNVAYERVLGLPGVAASPLVAAALARATFGPPARRVVSLRDLPVRRRLRERDHPADAAQLLRDGRGRRAAGGVPARRPQHPGPARSGSRSSR